MIEEGVLEDPHVDLVFGQHVSQVTPLGKVELRAGPAMAAADRFTLTVHGRGGHGAQPHLTVDPIVVGAHIVSALQTIVAREVDPTEQAVVTVGAFLAGEAVNVIPDTAEMRGTLRSFSPEVRAQLVTRVEEISRGIATAMRAEIEFACQPGYPLTVNDPEQTAMVREVAAEVVGTENVLEAPLDMSAEDFSYFLEQRPGCFYFVGSQDESKGLIRGHHHPKFDINEDCMAIGMEVMVRTVLRALNG
jgi:amidohydrolase